MAGLAKAGILERRNVEHLLVKVRKRPDQIHPAVGPRFSNVFLLPKGQIAQREGRVSLRRIGRDEVTRETVDAGALVFTIAHDQIDRRVTAVTPLRARGAAFLDEKVEGRLIELVGG